MTIRTSKEASTDTGITDTGISDTDIIILRIMIIYAKLMQYFSTLLRIYTDTIHL